MQHTTYTKVYRNVEDKHMWSTYVMLTERSRAGMMFPVWFRYEVFGMSDIYRPVWMARVWAWVWLFEA